MNTRQVPFFNYSYLIKENEAEVRDKMNEILARGAFILQKDLVEFETNLAKFLNIKHAIGVANGTDGLILALRAAGIQPNDEVILPSHTFIATAAAIHFAGGVPVLVECGADHMIDPAAVERAITPKTRFLMPVQLNGRTCNMDPLMTIARKHNLKIVEDAAQGLGSQFKGRYAGTFGVASAFSFYPAKVLGCFGDGGAVVTDDDEVARKIRALRDHGRDETGEVTSWGMNSRLDNIHAAVLDVKLKHYQDVIKRRRELASFYVEGLRDIKQIKLPPAPDANADHFDVFQNFEIEADRRDELKLHLAQNGIGTLIQWGGQAVHQLRGLGFEKVKLPVTETMTSRFLMLPLNMSLAAEDVAYVVEHIRGFYTKG